MNGSNVYLTLDQRIQSAVEEAIDAVVERYNPEGVSVIVSRPNDGSILALANYPTFDLNEFFNTQLYPIANQRNRAITDIFEPGSTFKIVPASGVLNESEVTQRTFLIRARQSYSIKIGRFVYRVTIVFMIV